MSLENARLPAGADRMLGILKRRGPQRAADLASALGVTAEAVRQQLLQLAQAELVSSEAPKRGVGRPSQVWSLSPAGHARFPDTPIVRVDRDTTRGRRARDALLDNLPSAGARILVGTQMLAKGHDLPHLTLVVVVGVDEGLHSVDFRAAEVESCVRMD